MIEFDLLVVVSMTMCLLCYAILIINGGKSLKCINRLDTHTPADGFPTVAVIVPVAGVQDNLPAALNSILVQDYPIYEIIIVTRNINDPAVPVIWSTIRGHCRARHVIAGPATKCGQKNYNLLAGVREVSDDVEILVFCDGTRFVPSHWIRSLVDPIVRNKALVSSGYHHVIPGDGRIWTLGHTITVLFLHLTKSIQWLNQPWGGGTAIKRDTFKTLNVEDVWRKNVVDDVSLAAYLRRCGVNVIFTPNACATTPLARETFGSWSSWFVRQILYLKYCLPLDWVVIVILCFLQTSLFALAVALCIMGMFAQVSLLSFLSACTFIGAITIIGIILRGLHPQSGPLLSWIFALYTALIVACWCFVCSIFTRSISWRGLTYRVTTSGKVVSIIQEGLIPPGVDRKT